MTCFFQRKLLSSRVIGIVTSLTGLLFCYCASAVQTQFYVATNGIDTNPGTLAQPFLTISKAASVMTAGDTCYILGGTYRETVTPANSGTTAAPITYCAYSNQVVTVSGANVVTGWSVYSNGIYKATFTGSLGDQDQVFVDGIMMNLARWPNTTLDVSRPLMEIGGTISTGVTNSDATITDTLTDTNLTQPSGFFVGAQIHLLPGPMYCAQTGLVTNYTPGTLTFHCFNAYPLTAGNPYYLFGLLSLLDTPGEWFINSNASTLYLWPPQNDSPINHTVEAKQREYGFDLSGKSYVTLQGLNLFACSVNSSSTSQGLALEELNCLYVTHFSLINTNGVFNYHTADTGIILNGTNNSLLNSSIGFSAGNGVTLLGASNQVENCVIHDVDYAQLDCGAIGTGVNSNSVHQVICSNTCYNSARCLLVVRRLTASRVNNNVLYRAMLRTSDGGAIYTFTHDGLSTEIDHNILSDNLCANDKASGIYLDSGSPDFVVDHNLIYNCSWALQYNLPNVNVKWFNNTAVASINSWIGGYFGSQTNSQVRNNIFTTAYGVASTNSGDVLLSNNLTNGINPLFVSTNQLDFQLQSNSPAVNAGTNLPPYTDGYTGSAPDVGAFEYGQTAWTAGATNIVLPPAGPTGLAASSSTSNNTIQLTWLDNSTTAMQMIIERSLDGQVFTELVRLPPSATNYTDYTVQEAVPYYYRVRADESPESNYQEAKLSEHDALGIIQANSLDAQSGGITIDTNCIGHCNNGYWAEYASTDFGAGATNISLSVASGATATNNYIDVHLDSTTGTLIADINVLGTGGYGVYTNLSSAIATVASVHDLYLVFKGGAGICNLAYFSFGSSVPLVAPPTPQGLTAMGIATNQVQVAWALTNGSQAGFAVESSTDNQNFTQIAVTTANISALVDSTLPPGARRYYRVRSFNSQGFSAYSTNVAGVSFPGHDAFSSIQANSLDAQSGGINLATNCIGSCNNGYWAEYAATDFGLGATNISLEVASGATATNNFIQVRLDSTNGTLMANINVLGTGGYGIYTILNSAIATVTGVHNLYLVFSGGAGVCNIEYLTFGSSMGQNSGGEPDMALNVNTNASTANFNCVQSGSIGSQKLNFSWAPDHLGWQIYSNAISLSSTNTWFPFPGSAVLTNEIIDIQPTKQCVFYELRYP